MDTSTRSAINAPCRRPLPRRMRRAVRGTCALALMAWAPLGCGLEDAPAGRVESSPFIEQEGAPAGALADRTLFDRLIGRGYTRAPGEPVRAPEPETAAQAPEPEPAPEAARPEPEPESATDEPAAPAPSDEAPAAPAPAFLPFLSIDDRLALIRDDLDAFDSPATRARMRYLDLSNLANAGLTEDALEPYRQAISLLVNSLSQGVAVVPPQPIDRSRLLYRLDLRDYAWNADTWERIVDAYPYAVRYDEDSRVLPYDERSAAEIRGDTGTLVPYIQGDWFLAHASSAPRYYDILGLDADVLDQARALGVDVFAEIADAQVARAGFNGSEVANNNRVIERHEMPGSTGALWLTYDFVNSVDARNVFSHPLDFEPDQTEGAFSLPNGLQAYFIADARLRLIDRASTAIVTDPYSRDHTVQAGISCMGGCHLGQGVLPANDEVRAYVVLSAPDAQTIDQTLALYAPQGSMAELVAADQERYRDAVAATGYEQADPNLLNALVRTHQDTLDLVGVAAVFGIKPGTLSRALDASPQIFPQEILPLRDPGARVHRDTLDAVAGQVAEGLGLGTQLRP